MDDWKVFVCYTSYFAFHDAGLDPWFLKAFAYLRSSTTPCIGKGSTSSGTSTRHKTISAATSS